MKGAAWQELARVERKLTTRYSKSVVVTIYGSETQGLAVRVVAVRSPIQTLLGRLRSSRGNLAEQEVKAKLEALSDPTLIDRILYDKSS